LTLNSFASLIRVREKIHDLKLEEILNLNLNLNLICSGKPYIFLHQLFKLQILIYPVKKQIYVHTSLSQAQQTVRK
jgi:hypothetical protein